MRLHADYMRKERLALAPALASTSAFSLDLHLRAHSVLFVPSKQSRLAQKAKAMVWAPMMVRTDIPIYKFIFSC